MYKRNARPYNKQLSTIYQGVHITYFTLNDSKIYQSSNLPGISRRVVCFPISNIHHVELIVVHLSWSISVVIVWRHCQNYPLIGSYVIPPTISVPIVARIAPAITSQYVIPQKDKHVISQS